MREDLRQAAPVITAAEPEGGCWCPACLMDTRMRIPLFADGVLAAVLEICPGCGTGHDKSAAYTVPVTEGPQAEPAAPRVPVSRRILAAARERFRPADERAQCAYGTCRRRARDHHCRVMAVEDGTMTWRFCGNRHLSAWLQLSGMA